MYSDREFEDYIAISLIRHFCYCPRRFGLVAIEKQWADNYRTTLGKEFHERAHDEGIKEKRGNVISVRALPLISHTYKLFGESDIVEFIQSDQGVRISGREGLWLPVPIDYKRGKQNAGLYEEYQLIAQMLCLSEMFGCKVEYGYLFFGQTKRREKVEAKTEIKNFMSMLETMHTILQLKQTPQTSKGKKCENCSLKEICFSVVSSNEIKKYLQQQWKELDRDD